MRNSTNGQSPVREHMAMRGMRRRVVTSIASRRLTERKTVNGHRLRPLPTSFVRANFKYSSSTIAKVNSSLPMYDKCLAMIKTPRAGCGRPFSLPLARPHDDCSIWWMMPCVRMGTDRKSSLLAMI